MGRRIWRPLGTAVAALALLGLGACDFFVSSETRLQKAADLRAKGDYGAAVVELKKVLQSQPDNREARLLLGEVSIFIGEPAAAEKELRRALQLGVPKDDVVIPLGQALLDQGQFDRALQELDPTGIQDGEIETTVLLLRGEVYLGVGKLDEAERAFREVLASHAESPDAQIGLAGVELGRRNFTAAETHVADVLSKDPAYARAWLAKGQLELTRSQFAQAEEAFAHVLELSPVPVVTEFLARNGLADSQWRQGKSAAALPNVERLLELVPQHPRPKYLRALIAYGAGEYETAKGYLQQALRDFPDYRPALFLLGATHYAQGELEQADMYLSSVLASDSSLISARKLLAATRLRQHKPRDAIATLTPALTPGNDDSQLLALMGDASFQAGDLAAGILYLKRSAGTDPLDQGLQMQLAAGYISAGDVDDAIHLLEKMPEGKEGAYGRDLLLILAYLRKGESDSAIAQVQRLVASRPDDPAVHNLAGSVYMAARQLPRAREQFETALRLQPDNPAVLMNLGRLEFQEGKQDDARARFEQVAALKPQNPSAMVALAQLSALRGDRVAAVQWLERASQTNPQAIEPKLLLVRYCLETGDLDRARSVATDAAKAAPADGRLQNALGTVQMAERKYEEAANSFAKAVAAAPRSPNFTYNLATAELARKRIDEGRRALARTLELQRDHVPATLALATLEAQEGSFGQAVARARILQQNKDTAADGHALEGDLLMLQSKFEDAARAYAAAAGQAPSGVLAIKLYTARWQGQLPDAPKPLEDWLRKHPDDVRVRLALAQSHQQRGQTRLAAAEYEAILKSYADNASALNNLAWAYFELKDARAIQTAERAHQLQPGNGAITDTLGWLLVQDGQLQRGVELLREAAKQAPDALEVRYHLAVGLAKTGANEEARRMLKELVNAGRTFKEIGSAKELLRQLGEG